MLCFSVLRLTPLQRPAPTILMDCNRNSELLTIPSLWINSKNGNRSVPPPLIPHFTISPRGGYASVTVELGARQVRVRKIGRPTLLL